MKSTKKESGGGAAENQHIELITTTLVMEGRHIENCTFFDAETISEHPKGLS